MAIDAAFAPEDAERLERELVKAPEARESHAVSERDVPIDLDTSAGLPALLLGAGRTNQRAVSREQGIAPSSFAWSDKHYVPSLVQYVEAGRMARPNAYVARREAELELRKALRPAHARRDGGRATAFSRLASPCSILRA